MIISLLGYMGSGKSHIGRLLARKLGFPFFETDAIISKKNNAYPAEIFKTKGELFFRKQERQLLEELLAQQNNCVISLGGGTPCYYNNMEILNQNSYTVYLQADLQTLVSRLKSQKQKRPLIAHLEDDQLPEFIAKHLFERNAFYTKSQLTISVNGKEPEEISEEIITKIYGS